MLRLGNVILFIGCGLAVAHYYSFGRTVQILAALVVACGLMRLLSSKRFN
jgi:hypothetical protein